MELVSKLGSDQLSRLQDGRNRQGQKEVLRTLYPWIQRVVFLLTLDRSSVEPITDEVFIELLQPYWLAGDVKGPAWYGRLLFAIRSRLRRWFAPSRWSEQRLLRRVDRVVARYRRAGHRRLWFARSVSTYRARTAPDLALNVALDKLQPLTGLHRYWLDRSRWRGGPPLAGMVGGSRPAPQSLRAPEGWDDGNDQVFQQYLHGIATQGQFEQAWDRVGAWLTRKPRPFWERVLRLATPLVAWVSRQLAWLLIALSIAGAYAVAQRQWREHCKRYELRVAAGGRDGESHQFLTAVKHVVEKRHNNVILQIDATTGTEENLRRLIQGEADLATAQADVVLNEWLGTESLLRASGKQLTGGIVAFLFSDTFQLLACQPQSQGERAVPISASEVFDKVLVHNQSPLAVYLPYEGPGHSGGQYRTFRGLADAYGALQDRDYEFVSAKPPRCDASEAGNLVFRVRTLGNPGVAGAINRGWRLVALDHAAGLLIANKALNANTIPGGTYRERRSGALSRSEPAVDIETVSLGRLLLARGGSRVPHWLVKEIAQMLAREGTVLARAHEDRRAAGATHLASPAMFLEVGSLNALPQISEVGLPIHPGAAAYYDPARSWFAKLNSNAEGLSILLTLLGVAISFIFGAFRMSARVRKDRADDLIQVATRLMTPVETTPLRSPRDESLSVRVRQHADWVLSDFNQLNADDNVRAHVERLANAQARQLLLQDLFTEASLLLDREEISQESFRTFNEAFRAAMDAIERELEDDRRDIALRYVRSLAQVQNADEVNRILKSAHPVLTAPLVFSRESFRTFMSTYRAARDSFR